MQPASTPWRTAKRQTSTERQMEVTGLLTTRRPRSPVCRAPSSLACAASRQAFLQTLDLLPSVVADNLDAWCACQHMRAAGKLNKHNNIADSICGGPDAGGRGSQLLQPH